MRPKLMEKVEELRGINAVKVKEASEQGKKVVGMYCVFSPQEIALAAGAIAVTLCGTKQEPIEDAEKDLPRNLCPLIKSSYGFAITDKCPYFYFSDVLLAETTCDGKKKMYELMGKIKPMHIMNLPQTAQGEEALHLWKREMVRFIEFLEDKFNVKITEEKLKEAIKLMNKEREVMKRLHQLNAHKPAPMTGMDMMLAQWLKGFNVDKQAGIEIIENLISEVQEQMEKGIYAFDEDAPRILLTGCPIGSGSEKVLKILEESGASVVALENCTGYKGLDVLVDEEKDPITALAEKYLSTPCSCMMSNNGRLDLIERLAKEYQVDGVVDLTWQACHTYNIESFVVKNFVKEKLDLPFIQIETDYSDSDIGQLKVRIEAFLETLISSKEKGYSTI
ncbi:Benzoyl-CoA reductase/2-hydroxyglutaryl-CoA dehydratase subunit, BcrC/BadD/HgdB [Alkalithermobacter thermoalcaliphilus JW-YL-7 = DSM 7308]|uniref:2-hydroxyglutaryl-CoA dehydratase D-component n=1 Tax=Alkalithermobacter thermoalcaliphilus JW-YL-7 = DSM 7308 TaxID=1121328 RepID=A0A150FS18_CLOPD|nr:2-hydroxyglutaryl-CoA dehydratase D-component [[Clostridium] paradoxum JW-YL-7 = DSM 7308]SHK33547.1 Benzoyl-CoA reductase/2-hydroxyglutaryl-CoA dehydratase subunit, BcrC/BadD/HgdB [[Clostridium] paradoxum JW-YL-7 = DSM 7308]